MMARDEVMEKAVDNPQPYDHRMLGIGADYIGVSFHGESHTHLDSLAHRYFSKERWAPTPKWEGKFYNGYAPSARVMSRESSARLFTTSASWR